MPWYGYILWFLGMVLFAVILTIMGSAFKKPMIGYDGEKYTVFLYVLSRTSSYWHYDFTQKNGRFYFKPGYKPVILWTVAVAVLELLAALSGYGEEAKEIFNIYILIPIVMTGMFLPQPVIAYIWIILNKDSVSEL